MMLFAQQTTGQRLVLLEQISTLLTRDWPIWLPLLIGGLAVFCMLPRPRKFPWWYGVGAGVAALILGGILLIKPVGLSPESVLFYAFAGLTILSGFFLVTQENPARAALSFALVVLSTSGLFLLLAAPFLMAASIIVYAGAIIVTFLFVVMLAQQHGHSDADSRSREPALATITGFLLLAVLLFIIRMGHDSSRLDAILKDIAAAKKAENVEAARRIIEPVDPSKEPDAKGQEKTLFTLSEKALSDLGHKDLVAKLIDIEQPLDGVARPGWFALRRKPEGETEEQERKRFEDIKSLLTVVEELLMQGKHRLGTLTPHDNGKLSNLSGTPAGAAPSEMRRDPKTHLPQMPADNAAFLGRSLFTDFLLPVEIAGMLLLIATVGAIAIAQRKHVADTPDRPPTNANTLEKTL